MITSLQNERVKYLNRLLSKRREREKEGKFVVEGIRECQRAIAGGFEVEEIYHCEALGSLPDELRLYPTTVIAENVFAKLAVRVNFDGILAVFKLRPYSLGDLKISNSDFFVVVSEIEKPGNLGAIIRSADGAGAKAIIVEGTSVDIFNPHTIRASIGSVFALPVLACEQDDIQKFFFTKGIATYLLAPDASDSYFHQTFHFPCAIVFGSEGHGVSEGWRATHVKAISIPMQGVADSLNVSVAAGVTMYEVLRQRSQS